MGSCLKILILEDDFINRRLIKKTILDSGYEVAESVGNVKDAVKCIEQRKIDLAILDINLGKNPLNSIPCQSFAPVLPTLAPVQTHALV